MYDATTAAVFHSQAIHGFPRSGQDPSRNREAEMIIGGLSPRPMGFRS